MDHLSKSEVLRRISESIEKAESIKFEGVFRKTKQMFKIDVLITEREHFIDENGVKWVRD